MRPHQTVVLALPALVSSVLLSGCVDGDGVEPGALVKDSAGVTITVVGSTPGPDVAPVIDTSWSPAAGDLGEIRDLAALEDGRVAILDGFDGTVTVLDPEGSVVARFGGAGEGPGEFNPQGVTALLWTGSSFLIPDLLQQRVTEFSEVGDLVEVFPVAEGGVYGVDWRLGPGGEVLLRDVREGPDPILRWTDGVVDTLLLLEDENRGPNEVLGAVPLWDARDDVVAVGRSDTWQVSTRLRVSEELSAIARRDASLPPLSDAEKDSLLRTLAGTVVRNSNGTLTSDEAMERLRLQISFPERRPAIAHLRFDGSGRLWIQVAAPIAELGPDAFRVGTAVGYGGRDWTVLARDGRSAFSVRFPEGFRPTRWLQEWVYGTLTTELGVETPARVRMPR